MMIIYLLFTGIVTYCSQENINHTDIRKGEHIERLSELLENVTSIIIDDIDRTYIDINPNIHSTVLIDSDLIGAISDVELDGEYIYIADRQLHQIIRYNTENGMIEKTGQEGRGPGDFNEPTEVRTNSEYIFVYETGNARLQIFNKELEYVSQISVNTNLSGRSSFFDVNENSIYIPSTFGSGEENAVQVHTFDGPINRVLGFMPRLIPLGNEPSALNIVSIRTEKNGDIYISYFGLPYLFVFDKLLNHVKSVKLSGKYVDDFYLNIPERLNSQNFQNSVFVRSFIRSLDINNNLLYVIIQGDLLVIDILEKKFLAKYRFKHKDEFYFGTLVRVEDSSLYLIDHSFYNRILKVDLDADGLLLNNAEFFMY